MTEFPPAFLKNLHSSFFNHILIIDMRGNEIMEVPDSFCKSLDKVHTLDLRHNKIKMVSEHIKAMMSLKILRLDFNQLTKLPDEVCDLLLIEELSVQQNRLTELP